MHALMNEPGKNQIKLVFSSIEKGVHILCWIMFLMVMFLPLIDHDTILWLDIIENTLLALLYISFFYLLLFRLYPLWYHDRRFFYVVAIPSIIIFIGFFLTVDHWMAPWLGYDNEEIFIENLTGAIISVIFFTMLSLAVFAHKYSLAKVRYLSQKEVQLAQSRQQLIQRELELMKIELLSYRNIFNTHLTFNTLSLIHAKVADEPAVALPKRSATCGITSNCIIIFFLVYRSTLR